MQGGAIPPFLVVTEHHPLSPPSFDLRSERGMGDSHHRYFPLWKHKTERRPLLKPQSQAFLLVLGFQGVTCRSLLAASETRSTWRPLPCFVENTTDTMRGRKPLVDMTRRGCPPCPVKNVHYPWALPHGFFYP